MSDKLTQPGCTFLFKWTLANILGWALGLVAGCVGFVLPFLIWMAIDNLVKLRMDEVSRIALLGLLPGAAGGALLGACVGRAQQLVLRPHLPLPRQWVLASAAAGAVGGAIGCTIDLAAGLAAGGAAGLILGFATAGALQYRVLRERVARAGWWVIASSVGGVLAFATDVGTVAAVTAFAVRRQPPDIMPGTLYARQMDAALRQVGQITGVTLGTLIGAALVGAILGAVLMARLRQPRAEAPDAAASPASAIVESSKPASYK